MAKFLLLLSLFVKLSVCTEHDIEIIQKAPCIEWLALPASYDGLNCPSGLLGFPFGYYEGVPAITVNLQDESVSEQALDMHKFLIDGDIREAIEIAPTEEGAIARSIMSGNAIIGLSQFPGQIPGHVPGQIPGFVPGQILGEVPGQVPGEVPGQVPGQVPGKVPGQVPGLDQIAPIPSSVSPPVKPLIPAPSKAPQNDQSSPIPAPSAPPSVQQPQLDYTYNYNQLSNCTQILLYSARHNKTITEASIQWEEKSLISFGENFEEATDLVERGFLAKFNPFSSQFAKFFSEPPPLSSPVPSPPQFYYPPPPPAYFYSQTRESFGPNFSKTKALLSMEIQCSYKDGISTQNYRNLINYLTEQPPSKSEFDSSRIVLSDGISAVVYYPGNNNDSQVQSLPALLVLNAITISAGDHCWPEYVDTSVSSYIKFQSSRFYIVRAESIDRY